MTLTWTIDAPTAQQQYAVIRLTGAVDSLSAYKLAAAIERLVEGGDAVIADLAGIAYISSAGWGAFINQQQVAASRGRSLILVAMQPQVRDVYDTIGLRAVLAEYDSLDEAVRAIGQT